MNRTARSAASVLVGLAVALVLLYVLIRFVGIDDVVGALRAARPAFVTAAFVVSLCWIAAWGYTLSLVLGSLDVAVTPRFAFLLYLNVLFANNIAPFSVGGGEPIAAVFVSRSSKISFEEALLAVLGTDVLNYLPAPLFAILGLLFVTATRTLGRQFAVVGLSLAAVALIVVLVAALGWRYRRRIERAAVTVLLTLQRGTRRVLPAAWTRSPASVQKRVDTFVDGLERVTNDRRVLALGVASSALGWVLQAIVLWFALLAVDVRLSLGVALFVTAFVTVTDLVPVPGGIGSVDAVLVAVLVAVTGAPAPTATAAALIFRAATLLFPIVLGGAVGAVLQTHASARA